MSRVDLSGALMHISDAKTFSSFKKREKKMKKNTTLGYIKKGERERGKGLELEREFTVMAVHLFTPAGCRINSSFWMVTLMFGWKTLPKQWSSIKSYECFTWEETFAICSGRPIGSLTTGLEGGKKRSGLSYGADRIASSHKSSVIPRQKNKRIL